MEHTNILDSEEVERSFLYGNHSLCCFAVNVLSLGIIAVILVYVDEHTVLSKFLEFFATFLIVMIVQLTLAGCYYSIQGLRLKEANPWRAGVSLFLHLGLALLLLFSLTFISNSSPTEPERIPISE